MMAISLALTSAFCFGLALVLTQLGLRYMSPIAGAAISDNKLALGGMENISLAVKLLLQIGILASVPNADEVRETRVPRSSTYVIASAMIQFAR